MPVKAVIQDNIITNIIVAPDGFGLPGATLITADPSWKIGGTYDSGNYTPPNENPGTATLAQINTERDRRLGLGFTYGGNPYDFDSVSKMRISGAGTLAGFAIGAGAPADYYLWHGGEEPFSWILQDNSAIQLDAPTMFAIAQYAAKWESRHVFAARALKDMVIIPLDFNDDAYWPVRGT